MNKSREKWEGSKLEGKTEESIELWLHTPSLSQTLSNPISRSRLLPSLRLCCYGNVCSWSSHQLQIVSKWRRGKRKKKSEEECEMMRRKEESQDTVFPKRTNWCICRLLLLMKAHSQYLYSHNWGNKLNLGRNILKQTDEKCSDHSAVGTNVPAAVLMKPYRQDPGGQLPAFNYRLGSYKNVIGQ